jgi:hypothetical protein
MHPAFDLPHRQVVKGQLRGGIMRTSTCAGLPRHRRNRKQINEWGECSWIENGPRELLWMRVLRISPPGKQETRRQ